jgi:hypothetical protein
MTAHGTSQTSHLRASAISITVAIAELVCVLVLSTCAAQPLPVAAERVWDDFHVFYGNLHAHTGASDGIGSPEEAIIYARDKARLDFIALTDHDYLLTKEEYTAQIALAQKYSDPQFLVVPGFEWSSLAFGHVLVFGSPEHTDIRHTPTLADLVAFARAHTAVLAIAHPGTTGAADAAFRQVAATDVIALAELGNGYNLPDGSYKYHRFDLTILSALARGWRLGLMIGQDNHHGDWGAAPGGGWIGVLAKSLDRAEIIEALRRRHVFATEDRQLRLLLTAHGRVMGDELEGISSVEFHIHAAHPRLAGAQITLFEDSYEQPIATLRSPGPALLEKVTFEPDRHGHLYFVRVDLPDGQRAWSSPIYRRVRKDIRSTALWTEPSLPTVGQPFRLMGGIYNAGLEAVRELRYRFYSVDTNALVAEDTVDLGPGEFKEVQTQLTPGLGQVTATFRLALVMPSGDFSGDNTAENRVAYCGQTAALQPTVVVTRDFGKTVLSEFQVTASGCPSALEILEQKSPVEYVAGLLYGINGVGSLQENTEKKLYWCFAVNDVKVATEGVGTYRVKPQEKLSFDLHSWEKEDWSKPSCTAAIP